MATNNKSRAARRKQTSKGKKPIWKKIILSLVIIFLVIGLSIGGLFAYYIATAPPIDLDKLDVPFASQLYDKDGESFAELFEENRIKIQYDDLPEVLIDAIVATEDARFFKHPGVDLRRMVGAVIANIRYGFGSEGASTITQQVVENMFLSPEKTLKLKVQEQWLALKLERKYSKEEIMEMYLNKIYYGANSYGVAKAAESYFGITDLHELNLLQAAMLAGLPQRPSAYNPFENPDLMEGRVDTVLKLMVRHNKISEAEANEARQMGVESQLAEKQPSSIPYEAFVQKVKQEVEEKLDGADINTDGLKIYTTLDTSIQEHVEFLLTDSEDNPIPYRDDEDLQAAMTVLDKKSGAIRAIGGSRNRENVDGYNYAIDLERQPGSSIKPIVAYGPAIEYEKWSTYHQIKDEEFTPKGSKPIRNWNRTYHGWVSARYALTRSLNVPAAKTLDEIGSERAKEFAENLGIKFGDEQLDPRDAIGGTKTGISPLQLAGALSAFGNEGIYSTPYAVTKVEFPDGTVVDLKPKAEAVMSDYTAYMVTDMLKSVLTEGTGTNAFISSLPVAGKTGTTNLEDKQGANNAWFGGYTTNYTIGVWTGYDENNRIVSDTQIPLYLFKETMSEISKDIETADFVKPSSVVEVEIEKGTNPPELPSEHTPKENIITELFVKGTEPTKVSEKFEAINPVQNLQAEYDESSNSIEVAWEYEDMEDIIFDVSYKVGDGEFKNLTKTKDLNLTINEVEDDTSYTIQVIAIDEETGKESDPATTSVKTPKEEEEDLNEIPPVDELSANFNEINFTIDVRWQYNGPPATFEVDINGEKRIVQSNSIQIDGISPNMTYTITVTPVNEQNNIRGESRSTSVTIDEQNDDTDNEPPNDDENEEQ